MRIIALLFCTLIMTGCATQPDPVATQPQVETSTPLSDGEKVVIETSQGQIEVAPTVVDMESSDAADNQFPSESLYSDPIEPFNRAMFKFNHNAYRYVLAPVARGYKTVVPAVARDKVGNAFANIREPLNMLNNLLAGEIGEAGSNLGRFLINSTVGIFGLFDPAAHWFEIEASEQSISDTLANYGVGHGVFIVIPLLGQSDTRGLTSLIGEGILHPVNQLTNNPDTLYIQSGNALHDFSDREDIYFQLYQQADDPYIYFRNQYLQGVARDAQFQPK